MSYAGTGARRSSASASVSGSSTIGKWPLSELDRVDAQQFFGDKALEGRLEELVLAAIHQRGGDVGGSLRG